MINNLTREFEKHPNEAKFYNKAPSVKLSSSLLSRTAFSACPEILFSSNHYKQKHSLKEAEPTQSLVGDVNGIIQILFFIIIIISMVLIDIFLPIPSV